MATPRLEWIAKRMIPSAVRRIVGTIAATIRMSCARRRNTLAGAWKRTLLILPRRAEARCKCLRAVLYEQAGGHISARHAGLACRLAGRDHEDAKVRGHQLEADPVAAAPHAVEVGQRALCDGDALGDAGLMRDGRDRERAAVDRALAGAGRTPGQARGGAAPPAPRRPPAPAPGEQGGGGRALPRPTASPAAPAGR